MEKPQSLAEFLGQAPSKPLDEQRDFISAVDHLSGKAFAEAILNSREFRQYILNGITLGDLPPAVVCRLIDHAWGKPVERLEVHDRTNELENVTPENLEQRALYLAQLARRIRETTVQEQQDHDTSELVH